MGSRSFAEQVAHVRAITQKLASPLSAEDQQIQSMPEASPTKWHLAHTTWFFETFLLCPHLGGYRPFSPAFEALYNSYYNSVGAQFPRESRGLLSRPSLSEVHDYRRHVDRSLEKLLQDPSPDVRRLALLGIHHEQQHQELLLTDIKHALWQNPSYPAYQACETGSAENEEPFPLSFVGFEGGTFSIGASESEQFSFDNEGPRHRVLLADFELASRPISHREVFAFIEAGGYENPLLWLSDGWTFCTKNQLKFPLYYVRGEDFTFSEFTLQGLVPVRPGATAAHLSYFEADAIARFLGARLPTEQEWECAFERSHFPESSQESPEIHPRRALPPPRGKLSQMLGSVWEWTKSPYVAYPGFVPQAGAVGEYNGKFMHNQMVLRGGSCATPSGHVRGTYRNFFPSSARWQFSGARLARGNQAP